MKSGAGRVMLVGEFSYGSLESSYQTAFESLGFEVTTFDFVASLGRSCRFGRAGRTLNTFLPVEPWVRKANREMVSETFRVRPDYLLTFGHYPIRAGALAQIQSSNRTVLVHVWPDPLLNFDTNLIACLPLFDLVASYSESTREPLKRLGAPNVAWIPLACDPKLHPAVVCDESDKRKYSADVTFIGGWRPEREAVLTKLGAFDLKVWGPDWGRRCRNNTALLKRWQRRPLYGDEFAKAVSSSKINLNIIDPMNYPAANMRFFELPVAGGLQVCSPCPEMEAKFVHGEHIFFYRDADELTELIAGLIEDEPRRRKVAAAARAKVLSAHTYTQRAQSILEHFENGRNSN
ncbi:MAG TPA: glycosyltransferase [Pyrinomonadaceae bacterium]|nr:glycosyltransferase [Pyrinomonadaceae bacterium]